MRLATIFLTTLVAFTGAYGAQVEMLVNPGFEDGVLTPWTTNNWTVETISPHSGTYCAEDYGNYWIRQDFTPTDVNDIVSVIIWAKQPDVVIFAFDFFYGPSDYDEDIYFPSGPDWEEYDLTSVLRSSGNLEAIRMYGYSGGGDGPTYLDDASIIYDDGVGIESASLGSIKAIFK
ncbi:MAG: hypothetical protein GY771_01405 [bacterium]|nr:hypothetical protein [bacterium]